MVGIEIAVRRFLLSQAVQLVQGLAAATR
jgi:hypothetical protein